MTEQIIVQLNPDVPPTGSDLGVVNAARKSFGRRSEWAFEGGKGGHNDYHPAVLKTKTNAYLSSLLVV